MQKRVGPHISRHSLPPHPLAHPSHLSPPPPTTPPPNAHPAVPAQVKTIVDDAAETGDLDTREWEREPVPSRDSSRDRKRQDLGTRHTDGGAGGTWNKEGSRDFKKSRHDDSRNSSRHYERSRDYDRRDRDYDRRDDRHRR